MTALAPSSVRALEERPEITIVCVQCGMARIPDDGGMEVTIVPGQTEELAAQGVDIEEGDEFYLRKPGT